MTQITIPESFNGVMRDDTLAARLLHGHDYKASLVGDTIVDELHQLERSIGQGGQDTADSFLDGLMHFFQSVPWVVYVILGVVLAEVVLYWCYRKGLLHAGFATTSQLTEEDNIYEVDFDAETAEALRTSNYAALVRLVYLRTLRSLDESGRLRWRLSKTPAQYAAELSLPAFTTMTNHFMRVRYGRFEASPQLYATMQSLQEEVLRGGVS